MHCRIGGLSDEDVERAPLVMVTRDELQYGEGAGAALSGLETEAAKPCLYNG